MCSSNLIMEQESEMINGTFYVFVVFFYGMIPCPGSGALSPGSVEKYNPANSPAAARRPGRVYLSPRERARLFFWRK